MIMGILENSPKLRFLPLKSQRLISIRKLETTTNNSYGENYDMIELHGLHKWGGI